MARYARQARKEGYMKDKVQRSQNFTSRRSFLRKGLAVGGAGIFGTGLLGANGLPVFAEAKSGGLSQGDAAILRFLSAAEILETDLWQQDNEMESIQDKEVPGGRGNALSHKALSKLNVAI